MIITDGAPETFEDIFKKYNWPDKYVRLLPTTKFQEMLVFIKTAPLASMGYDSCLTFTIEWLKFVC